MLDPFFTHFLISVEEIPIGVTVARSTLLVFCKTVVTRDVSPLARRARLVLFNPSYGE